MDVRVSVSGLYPGESCKNNPLDMPRYRSPVEQPYTPHKPADGSVFWLSPDPFSVALFQSLPLSIIYCTFVNESSGTLNHLYGSHLQFSLQSVTNYNTAVVMAVLVLSCALTHTASLSRREYANNYCLLCDRHQHSTKMVL